jgi:hypothetical protein
MTSWDKARGSPKIWTTSNCSTVSKSAAEWFEAKDFQHFKGTVQHNKNLRIISATNQDEP